MAFEHPFCMGNWLNSSNVLSRTELNLFVGKFENNSLMPENYERVNAPKVMELSVGNRKVFQQLEDFHGSRLKASDILLFQRTFFEIDL